MPEPLEIDGSRGEGGGQILRTALALALVAAKPLRIRHIRARRAKPGLRRQHLCAVQAAAAVGRARVVGAEPGSQELLFEPSDVVPGEHTFRIGTAGSATLVLETVIPALLSAGAHSRIVVEGGTHNPLAPPFEFLERAFLPLLNRMGPRLTARLERHGFYPAGGGRLRVEVHPARELAPLYLPERGPVLRRRAQAIIAHLPRAIAERELTVVASRLGLGLDALEVVEATESAGPGNALLIEIASSQVTELFSCIGERGIAAERVALRAVSEALRYLEADVPVGVYLADQLLLPIALGGGAFVTLEPSPHTRTNAEVIEQILGVRFALEQIDKERFRIQALR